MHHVKKVVTPVVKAVIPEISEEDEEAARGCLCAYIVPSPRGLLMLNADFISCTRSKPT